MSEREELAAEVGAELSDWPYWVGEASHGVRMLDVSVDGAIADLTTWLRAHDDRIRAEALLTAAESLPALTEGPLRVGTSLWLECDRDAYSLAIEEAQAALRAAAGTPTHHTTEEEGLMGETCTVHGIDRHTQDHLCGAPSGLGTDGLAPSMPITCTECRATRPGHRDGDCWLCTHPVWGPRCSACGCLAHYPPWPDTPADLTLFPAPAPDDAEGKG